MKHALFAILLGAGVAAGPAVAGSWDTAGGFLLAQAQKGRQGGGNERGERGDRGDRGDRGREARPDERRERMTEDERRSLHRDLDKANRELYGRRPQR